MFSLAAELRPSSLFKDLENTRIGNSCRICTMRFAIRQISEIRVQEHETKKDHELRSRTREELEDAR